MRLHSPLTQ
ncbi:hypothetical protein VCHC51A1_2619, partial [Vibrio cholerae HC-51A1]